MLLCHEAPFIVTGGFRSGLKYSLQALGYRHGLVILLLQLLGLRRHGFLVLDLDMVLDEVQK
jgi:hypothetical protein